VPGAPVGMAAATGAPAAVAATAAAGAVAGAAEGSVAAPEVGGDGERVMTCCVVLHSARLASTSLERQKLRAPMIQPRLRCSNAPLLSKTAPHTSTRSWLMPRR